ncbi:Hypothetical predicted protein [Octopus vulgaris]|uniref:Uncharacterized protein n=1 Tax=Octopus vulgaris TaxID=6645 RepID=A0AA36B9K5_OCTVU|nr:Hypothetical predicted protein [Octopus vulgaris]
MKYKWWTGISEKIPRAYICKDLKTVYHLIGQVLGLQYSFVIPLKSKDSCFLFKDHEGIMKRWTEYFTDLFYNPSVIDKNVFSNLPEKNIIYEMMEHPTLDEIKKTIKELNTGKAPGIDGIPVEIFLLGDLPSNI